jgi:hypothetical protein
VARFPGRDDDEIASVLKIVPRQTVNQICRRLCEGGLLRREPGGRGKLVNFAISEGYQPAMAQKPIHTETRKKVGMSEDKVKGGAGRNVGAERVVGRGGVGRQAGH